MANILHHSYTTSYTEDPGYGCLASTVLAQVGS